jgi:hypothetical protein
LLSLTIRIRVNIENEKYNDDYLFHECIVESEVNRSLKISGFQKFPHKFISLGEMFIIKVTINILNKVRTQTEHSVFARWRIHHQIKNPDRSGTNNLHLLSRSGKGSGRHSKRYFLSFLLTLKERTKEKR